MIELEQYLNIARKSMEHTNESFSDSRLKYLKKCSALLKSSNFKNIALYGIGEHTRKLINYLADENISNSINICCLINREKSNAEFCNLPVLDIEQAIKNYELDAIIISSYKYENVIYERIKYLEEKDKIAILKIYDEIIEENAEERVYFEPDEAMGITMIDMGEIYYQHLNRYYWALGYVKNKVVIDMACGSGYGSAILSTKAKKVIGIDIDESTIEYAKKHYKNNNLDYQCCNILEADINTQADVIISFETIEHITDETLYFNTIKRLLSKDGVFIVSTPVCDSNGQSRMNKYHTNEYTIERFGDILNKHFKDVIFYRQDENTNGAISIDDGKMLGAKSDSSYMLAVCYS